MSSDELDLKEGEGTHIDLGEDLLEKTVFLPVGEPSVEAPPSPPSQKFIPVENGNVEDLLASGQILLQEGFIEDAKRVLRRVLILDSSHALARKLLQEIQEQEIKQLLHPSSELTPSSREATEKIEEELLSSLESELSEGGGLEFSLFQDEALRVSFCEQLEDEIQNHSVRDWLDLGVGFCKWKSIGLQLASFRGPAGEWAPRKTLIFDYLERAWPPRPFS